MVDKSPVCRLSHLRARVTTTVKATVMSTAIQTGRQAGRRRQAEGRSEQAYGLFTLVHSWGIM